MAHGSGALPFLPAPLPPTPARNPRSPPGHCSSSLTFLKSSCSAASSVMSSSWKSTGRCTISCTLRRLSGSSSEPGGRRAVRDGCPRAQPGPGWAPRTSDGVVEVVDDHGDVARLQQLQHAVAADVAGAARHQDLLCHGSLRGEKPQTLQLRGGHSPTLSRQHGHRWGPEGRAGQGRTLPVTPPGSRRQAQVLPVKPSRGPGCAHSPQGGSSHY